jgi:N-acetylglucosaminyldiphosphoundecaprenol N-acetyl-beta-D-mannosaminyltransferase
MARPETVEILGVRFHNKTRREAAEEIARLAANGKHYVVKPYSEFMPRAARDRVVRDILNGADLCLPDGVGILWAAHYLSLSGGTMRALVQLPISLFAMVLNPGVLTSPIQEPMAGVDLTWAMLEALDVAGRSVYLLGGSKEEVTAARSRIAERLPGLRVLGVRDGYFSADGVANEGVIQDVNAAKPDVLLVAMGFPRQERWIASNLESLEVHAAVAEGGSFSFIAGTVSRAPRWMRRGGLEWLYRLGRQPWRIKRQIALPRFVWLVLRERLQRATGLAPG